MSRENLLNAAVELAVSGVITTIDVDRIVIEAGSTAAEYRHEFADDAALLEALHGHHISMLVSEIGVIMATLPPGRVRLARAIDVFWAGCIARIPVRRLIKNARAIDAVDIVVRRKNRAFEFLLQPELKTIGDPTPMDSARLLRVMVEEVAQAEFEAAKPQPQLRQALWRMFDGGMVRPAHAG